MKYPALAAAADAWRERFEHPILWRLRRRKDRGA
jgi:hypothetical protein